MDEIHNSRSGSARDAPRVLEFVLGGSEAGDEGGASSLGIAVEPVLVGAGPIRWPASVLPTAVRDAEVEAIRLRHVSSITARSARCWSSRKRASRRSAGRPGSRVYWIRGSTGDFALILARQGGRLVPLVDLAAPNRARRAGRLAVAWWLLRRGRAGVRRPGPRGFRESIIATPVGRAGLPRL